MAALRNRAGAGHYIFARWFFLYLLSSFYRLDVYHTSTHGVALVWV